jgi:MFS family permease
MPSRLVYLCLTFSIACILFSLSGSIPLSMFFMVFLGLAGMMTMATTNTLIQSISSLEMRGRVISLYTMASASMSPLGSLLMGTLSSRIGARFTLIVCGLLLLLWSLNGLRIVPKFLRGVLRMLVISDNTDVYRQRVLAPEISAR